MTALPELGQVALLLALLVAALQALLPLLGAQRGIAPLMAVARPAAGLQLGLVLSAFAILTHAFITSDFSVRYVAENSNSLLPLYYRVTAVWGAHEGSLLLWALILSVWTAAVALFSRALPQQVVARVLGVMGIVSFGFLAFLIFTSNPFARLLPGAAEGRDLNPLLQDPGMIIHPPMLYLGYVGFSVPFAFAIAALLDGKVDARWLRWTRPWTNVAWGFLTLGIALGSWWAYYELGWGGWWFWDPVENASFMPWLVRSGVLTSVHAFAADPTRGLFVLVFLGIVIGGSLVLYALRAPSNSEGAKPFVAASRETLLLLNNLLLTTACAMVLLGTLYPLLADALELGKISVGPPYFAMMFLLLMAPLVALLPFGPLTRWQREDMASPLRMLAPWAALALLLGTVAFFIAPQGQWKVAAGVIGAVWVLAGTLRFLWSRFRTAAQRAPGTRLTREMLGMVLAHTGIAVFLVGALLVEGLSQQRELALKPGESVTLGRHAFRFDGVDDVLGPNFTAERGSVQVLRDDKPWVLLHPEKRRYVAGGQVMTEAGIAASVTGDAYVALGESLGGGAWAVRVHTKPFVRWVWFGALLMALGGFVTATDRRFRVAPRSPASGEERT